MLGGSPHRRPRTGLWFAAFTVASLLLLLASRTEAAISLQQVTARALDPVRSVVAGVGESVAGVFGTIGEIDRLRTENDRLRRELAGAEQRIAELGEAARDNQQLRELLGLTRSLEMELLPVRLVSRDPSNFTWEIGIDAGSENGLRVGMPVLGSVDGAGALVGTVVAVGPDLATVRLVIDTRSAVVARDQETGALGLVRGQLGGQLVMTGVPLVERVAVGNLIVSAGITLDAAGQRSAYPRGMLIGRVAAFEPDPNALTQTVFVRPALDFASLERLLVVLSFSGD